MSNREERRVLRAQILEALNDETGSYGGGTADERVPAYIDDPLGASTVEFGYVGGLALRRFYISPDKPDATERDSLWDNLSNRIDNLGDDPGGWDGSTRVLILQAIVESAIQ